MIGFQLITATSNDVDSTYITVEENDYVVIVWRGAGIPLVNLHIEDSWPYDQPKQVVEGDSTAWFVTYRNSRGFGRFHWSFEQMQTRTPPEIINEGGGGGGDDRR